MNRICLSIIGISLFLFSSCGKYDYLKTLQGTWKVVEMHYIFDEGPQPVAAGDTKFIFHKDKYETWTDGTLTESGTYSLSGFPTKMTFHGSTGKSVMRILEEDDTHQHWKSDHKILDFYVEIWLEKEQ